MLTVSFYISTLPPHPGDVSVMIQVSGLTFQYSRGTTIRFPDFKVAAGEHVLLLGESGSGKTTLLHLTGGLLRNYHGSIKISTTELSTLSESALDHFRGRNMGFVFQRNHLISALTVEQNLAMPPFLANIPADSQRIADVLLRLGLEGKAGNKVTELSQGQAQRVAIARAIINKPAILFADEPTSALDDKNCERVVELLLSAARETHATLVVATHDQRLRERINNRILLT